jgi:hypothetical protein
MTARVEDCFWCGNLLNGEGVCTHCASSMERIRSGLMTAYQSKRQQPEDKTAAAADLITTSE